MTPTANRRIHIIARWAIIILIIGFSLFSVVQSILYDFIHSGRLDNVKMNWAAFGWRNGLFLFGAVIIAVGAVFVCIYCFRTIKKTGAFLAIVVFLLLCLLCALCLYGAADGLFYAISSNVSDYGRSYCAENGVQSAKNYYEDINCGKIVQYSYYASGDVEGEEISVQLTPDDFDIAKKQILSVCDKAAVDGQTEFYQRRRDYRTWIFELSPSLHTIVYGRYSFFESIPSFAVKASIREQSDQLCLSEFGSHIDD